MISYFETIVAPLPCISVRNDMCYSAFRVYLYRYYLGLAATKPVFWVYNKTRLKPVSSATETSWKIEISLVASLEMILSKKRITKVLIILH